MASLGQCYVLKLRGGKWYVGWTENGYKRIQAHEEKRGAKWTKKHPPVKPMPFKQTEPGKTEATEKNKPKSDEDKLTLELMKKHGIENVRGGSWVMSGKMKRKTVRELEALIGKTKGKAALKKKKPTAKKAKSRVAKGYCIRCEDRIKFVFERPLCKECYGIWSVHNNPEYIENYCHKCGQVGWDTTIVRPLCIKCFRK